MSTVRGGAKTASAQSAATTPVTVALLSLLTITSSISFDVYLPALPELRRELDATASQAQITMTACLLGIGLGQLVIGPLADRYGRKPPLLIGLTAYVVASLACAASPSIESLTAARFVQGLAAAVGIVTAQAAGRDLYSGSALLRYYGRLALLNGTAAVAGPLVGGQLVRFTDWRGTFLFLAAVGAALLGSCVLGARETLPRDLRRRSQGLRHAYRDLGKPLLDRPFLGAALVLGFSHGAMFAYLGAATFVLQDIYGLTPQQYALCFGTNSFGFILFATVSSRVATRWSYQRTIGAGLALATVGAAGLLAAAVLTWELPTVLVFLFSIVGGIAFTVPATTALAMAGYREMAGTAASLLQSGRFLMGSLVAPLAGVGGVGTAVPFGVVALVSLLISGSLFLLLVVRGQPADELLGRDPSERSVAC